VTAFARIERGQLRFKFRNQGFGVGNVRAFRGYHGWHGICYDTFDLGAA